MTLPSLGAFCAQLATLALLCCAPAFSLAASYAVTDLGTLGGTSSSANSINASGQIVGYSYIAGDTNYRAFLFSNGVMQDLGTLGGKDTFATSINDSGAITGIGGIPQEPGTFVYQHAFLYTGGVMHDLGVPGGPNFGGRAINSLGQIVGKADSTSTRAFLYSNGTFQDLGAFGGSASIAWDINDNGQIVGVYFDDSISNSTAFLYSNGVEHDLGTLGGTRSQANAINNNGEIVGVSTLVGNSIRHAFLYSNGIMHDLGSLGGTLSSAIAINNRGQIVGSAYPADKPREYHAIYYDGTQGLVDLNTLISPSSGWVLNFAYDINDAGQIVGQGTVGGQSHAFLLTPIPEPSSLSLAAFGLISLAAWSWRRRK